MPKIKFTPEEEALFQEWYIDTGFDSDYMDEKCARRIWYKAYKQGYEECQQFYEVVIPDEYD